MKETKIGLWVVDLMEKIGLQGDMAVIAKAIALIICILIVAIIANLITKRIILSVVTKFIIRTRTKYDDIFLRKKVFQNLSHIVPALIILYSIEIAIPKTPDLIVFVQTAMYIYMVVVFILVINSFLNALYEVYLTFKIAKKIPVKGYIQVLKIVVYFIGTVSIISLAIGKSPFYLLTGLGAVAAVLILVFKDTILGFVASIQLTAYDMVKPGDWISMPNYNADGDVIDISITTVKVQNWDKTISTIPTYSLVSNSFKNWKGMDASGGRRICRNIYINLNSIKFCTPEMLARFQKIDLLKEYVLNKKQEIEKHNKENNIDKSVEINGRAMTNIGTFRKYVELYLQNHPGVNTNLTLIVRQLKPDENGLPIQIYCFSKDQRWYYYEELQSDIFDHILTIVSTFELELFQRASGRDLKRLN